MSSSYVQGMARRKLEKSKRRLGISQSSIAGRVLPSIWTSVGTFQPGISGSVHKGRFGMNSRSSNAGAEMGSLPLGLGLSVIMATGFFSFIIAGAFFPRALCAPASAAHPISIGLVWGFGLIVLSVITTLTYALQANLSARKATR
jgi:uncharacterized protein DUF485